LIGRIETKYIDKLKINGFQYVSSILLGLIGAIVGGAIYFGSVIYTHYAFGLIIFFTGAFAGFCLAFGYKIGGGRLKRKEEIIFLKYSSMLVGALSGVFGYFGLYFLGNLLGIPLSFSEYIQLIDFGIVEIIFIAIGGIGGNWIIGRSMKFLYRKEIKEEQERLAKEIKRALEEAKKKKAKKKSKKNKK